MAPPAGRSRAAKAQTAILAQITTPLGFYVLALLIVEGTLAMVLSWSKLDGEKTWMGFLCMVGLFVFVVVIVSVLAWRCPEKLLFGKEEHLASLVEPPALRDQIEDMIYKNVKAECLKKPETPT